MQQSEPLSQGWHRGAIKDSQVAHGLSYYYYGETRRLQGDYIQEIRQQSSTAEKNDEQKRRLHYQERTSISDFIEDSATAEDDDLQKNDVDNELALIEKAFDYLTRKTYPPGCSKNDKRVIRRKTEKH